MSVLPCCGFQTSAPRQTAFVRQQIEREGVLPGFQIRQAVRPLNDGPHDFLAGGIAQGMNDAEMTVPAFAPERQAARLFVEARPQVMSSRIRSGASRTTMSTIARSHRVAACLERVGHVVLEAVLRVEHAGDAPLSVVAVGLQQALLGDHQHAHPRVDGQCRSQAGQPAADHQHVGEMVRHAFGIERNQVAGRGHRQEGGEKSNDETRNSNQIRITKARIFGHWSYHLLSRCSCMLPAGCPLPASSLRLRRAGGVSAILIRIFGRRTSPQPFAARLR